MFTRQLHNADPSMASKLRDPATPKYQMGDYSYGKRAVRVFQLKKKGALHEVLEFKVSSQMRLRTHKEYYEADNTDIVGSDVQETNIYVHAQRHGLHTPEQFALTLTQHFLDNYAQATDSNVLVEDQGWSRLGERETQGSYKGRLHNHAFVREVNGTRYCEVVRRREDPTKPLVIAGLKDMRVLKTAKAPFTGYVKGALFTEGDMPDRILCTDINARWQYSRIDNIDWETHWYKVRDLLLQSFAGEPEEGIVTTSVQYVAYMAERKILDAIPEICSVSINLPNYGHLPYDFSKFPPIVPKADVIISNPKETPLGIGYAQLDRLNKL